MSRVLETLMKVSFIGRNDGWVFLDKMTFAPGTVLFKVLTSTNGIPYGTDGTVTI